MPVLPSSSGEGDAVTLATVGSQICINAKLWQAEVSSITPSTTTTTSTTEVVIPDTTITPPSGTYLYTLSGYVAVKTPILDNPTLATGFISMYKAVTKITHTERKIRAVVRGQDIYTPLAITAKVTVNGSEALDARWHITNNASTLTIWNRAIQLVRIGD